MNCNNLTGIEAMALFYSTIPIDDGTGAWPELAQRIKDIHRGIIVPENYGNVDVEIGGNRGTAPWVRDDFRGFLSADGWIIYIGDETQVYWATEAKRRSIAGGDDYLEWTNWRTSESGLVNHFAHGPLYDITDLICKVERDTPYINWRTDPFEVKP